jgi:hypothetical protein
MGVRDEATQDARVQPAPARGEEERIACPRGEGGPRVAEVAGDGVRSLLSQGHDALLVALAAHPHCLLFEVHVGEVEADGLRTAQAAGVDELEQRMVAKPEWLVVVEGVEQPLDLSQLRRVGKPPRPARRQPAFGHVARPGREAEKGSHGGQAPGDCRRREAGPLAAELGRVVGERTRVDVGQVASGRNEPAGEVTQIHAIRPASGGGEPRRGEEA